MQQLPHIYIANASGGPEQPLNSGSGNLPELTVAPPLQFGGPGGIWSPEELLMSSITSCLVLSFRAIAKASGLQWQTIDCHAEGKLDKVERKIQFTAINTKVVLTVMTSEDIPKAEKLLQKAEQSCFISNSLACESHFQCQVNAIPE